MFKDKNNITVKISFILAATFSIALLSFSIILDIITFIILTNNTQSMNTVLLLSGIAVGFTIFMLLSVGFSYVSIHFKQLHKTKNPKVGIIIAISTPFSLAHFYFNGIFWLIWSLLRRNICFRIYFINSKSEFEEVFINKNLRQIYIFGHGAQYYLGLNKRKKIVYSYRNLKSKLTRNKQFVAQLHCNVKKDMGKNDCSLKQFANKSYITENYLYSPCIWWYLFRTFLKNDFIYNN